MLPASYRPDPQRDDSRTKSGKSSQTKETCTSISTGSDVPLQAGHSSRQSSPCNATIMSFAVIVPCTHHNYSERGFIFNNTMQFAPATSDHQADLFQWHPTLVHRSLLQKPQHTYKRIERQSVSLFGLTCGCGRHSTK